MKTLKPIAIIAITALLLLITVGANSANNERPENVPAERWLPVAANAGFVLSADVSGAIPRTPPPPVKRYPNEVVAAEFYVKTRVGWQRARIDNPAFVTPLNK